MNGKLHYLKHALFGGVLGILALLLCGWSLPRLVALYSENRIAARQEINKLNDGQNYALPLSELLGDGWFPETVYTSDVQEDAAGWDGSIAGSVVWGARRGDAYVRYTVYTYTSAEVAQERYTSQTEWVITLDSGVPVSRQIVSFEPVELSISLQAQDQQVACQNILGQNLRCAAFFRYSNHIAYIDAFLIRNGETLLTFQDLESVFSAIDENFLVKSRIEFICP